MIKCEKFKRLLLAIGLDFHIIFTLVSRGWVVLAGGLTVLLIPAYLSSDQQGYYFTFNSVLATQIFFELGLNHVITQLASHSAAHLKMGSDGKFEGDNFHRFALVSLIKLSRKWNAIMAGFFFASLLLAGSYFFQTKGTLPFNDWILIWIVLVGAVALNLAASSQLAICEGLGQIGQVARMRLFQLIIGYLALWILLLSGQGLWAVVAVPITSFLVTLWWLVRHKEIKMLCDHRIEANNEDYYGYSWIKDIFPLQWKIGLSWISGYFIFSFLTPMIFAYQGVISAGKLGLALTIYGAITTVGTSWISAKVPTMSQHIARRENVELNKLFDYQIIRSIGATVICVLIFITSVKLSVFYSPKLIERLPSLMGLTILGFACVVNVAIYAMASYVRAHKEEPLVAQSISVAVITGFGVYFMAHIGLNETIEIYTAIIIGIAFPWCFMVYKKYRNLQEFLKN